MKNYYIIKLTTRCIPRKCLAQKVHSSPSPPSLSPDSSHGTIMRSCYRSVLFYNTFVLSFCALLYVRVIVLYSSIIRSCYRSVLFYNTFVLSFCALLKSALYILQLCNSQRSNAVAREISNYMQIMWLASIILLYQKLLSKSTWKTFLAVVRFFTIS